MSALIPPAFLDPLAHVGLVRFIARTLHRGSLPLDDLVQEGMLALVQALPLFDPARGRLAPFIARRVRWAQLRAIRNFHSWGRCRPANCSDLESLHDHRPPERPSADTLELLEGLGPRERRLLGWWLDGMDQPAIARLEGCTRQRIGQVLAAAIQKVRQRVSA